MSMVGDKPSATPLIVIGSGPSGTAFAMLFRALSPKQIIVLERHGSVGLGSPVRHPCAARMISQNVSDSTTLGWFQTMELCIEEQKEDRLSSTNERPHGWNRATGQWVHHQCLSREMLFANTQRLENITLLCGKNVTSLSICGDRFLLTVLGSDNDTEIIECQNLVLALPAHEALRLVKTLFPTECIASLDALRVLDRCSRNYEKRYCKTIHFNDLNSVAGIKLMKKFQDGWLKEIDVSTIEGDVTLVSLDISSRGDEQQCGGGHGEGNMQLHMHGRCEEALAHDKLSLWVASWLGLDEGIDVGTGDEQVFCFSQSRPSTAPLSPMRERGCILVTESPPLLCLCGDWAVAGSNGGTVHGALLSAHKAAKVVAERLNA